MLTDIFMNKESLEIIKKNTDKTIKMGKGYKKI